MPEYLSPGVYVEETSFRAKSIEGVSTSTAGFVGQARYGPIHGIPPLITSFDEFQRHFGGLDDLLHQGSPTTNYLAHAVQLFFANGGRRVYIARIFAPDPNHGDLDAHFAIAPEGYAVDPVSGNESAHFRARFPGRSGNLVVRVSGIRSGNLLSGAVGNRRLAGLRPGDAVEVRDQVSNAPAKPREVSTDNTNADAALDPDNVWFVRFDNQGRIELTRENNAGNAIETLDWNGTAALGLVQRVTLNVLVSTPQDGLTAQSGREDLYQGLAVHPASESFIGTVLRTQDYPNGVEPPADRTARIYLQLDPAAPTQELPRARFAHALLTDILGAPGQNNDDARFHQQILAGGHEGLLCTSSRYQGSGEGNDADGLVALGEIDDIAIVAAPTAGAITDDDDRRAVRQQLITHCESLRYRFAILFGEADLDTSLVRTRRGEIDSKYAAFYYPWLVVQNPFNANGQGRDTIQLPPDGAVAGVYARSDVERGVHKAPANEVVRNVLRFSRNVNTRTQDVLNPEGINCLRFFEGRGYRVWGARTVSSDPEWTYLNVRRLFIYLEHSIDRGTQWAVFEPNNEQLWLKIRLTIESFLYDTWRTGALMGTSPEEAFFVRCDRTTMSQGDLDNGRLICLIGVAPTKPAEYVIFRIGQWTADASII